MNVDLTTRYLGMVLKNPLVASSSPLTGNVQTLCELEQAGAAAVVLPSLFEETIEHEAAEIARLYDYQTQSHAESLSYFPELESYNIGPDHYLLDVKQAKQAVEIPVIASLNGVTPGGWTRFARRLEDAGADALELNIYFVPTDPLQPPDEVERRYFDLIRSVREMITIPLAVKVGPFFTSIPYTARRLIEAGADGLVFFNRYLEPDIDLDALEVEPQLILSKSQELRLPLRWLAIVRSGTEASLAATSGIHTAADVLKALLAGADATMMASALLQRGAAYLSEVLAEVERWLLDKEYVSVEQLKGSMSRTNIPDASRWERANYTKALVSFTNAHHQHRNG